MLRPWMHYKVALRRDGKVVFEFGHTDSIEELAGRFATKKGGLERLLADSAVGVDIRRSMDAVCAIVCRIAKSRSHQPDVRHALELLVSAAQAATLLDVAAKNGALVESKFTTAVLTARRILDGDGANGPRDIHVPHGVWQAQILEYLEKQRLVFRDASATEKSKVVEAVREFVVGILGRRPSVEVTRAALAAEAPKRGAPRKSPTRRATTRVSSPPTRDEAIRRFFNELNLPTTPGGIQKLRERSRKKDRRAASIVPPEGSVKTGV